MEGGYLSFRSSVSSSREIEETAAAAVAEEKVYVAVAEDFKHGKSILVWAIQNLAKDATIVVAHVHVPAQMIPMMGTRFHVSKLKEQEVRAYRYLEREKMETKLDQYLKACAQLKVRAEKVIIEMDDIAKGLEELISLHGITKLVMGAAADKHYSKKMKTPRSKTATRLLERADPSCYIWFVCKGILICTREASVITSAIPPSPAPSSGTGSVSSLSDQMGSLSLPQGTHDVLTRSPRVDLVNWSRSDAVMVGLPPTQTQLGLEPARSIPPTQNQLGLEPARSIPVGRSRAEMVGPTDLWDRISRRQQSHSSEHSLWTVNDDTVSNSGSASAPSLTRDSECEEVYLSPRHDLEDLKMEADMFDKLQEALNEAEMSKREAYEESNKRRKAERELLFALQKVRELEALYLNEMRQRRGVEETLTRERLETEQLKNQLDGISGQLQDSNEQQVTAQRRITELEHATNDLEDKLRAMRYLLQSLQENYDSLLHERDNAVREAEELRSKAEQMGSSPREALSSEFSFVELEEATKGFSESLKIGEGGFGSVYKGFLRNTTVAVKMLHPQSMQGRSEFHQEIAVLSRVRHPNLVTLIGACPEAFTLVYEFLPNGSLEDRLARSNNTPPLTWQARTRIIGEICNALIFLHSSRPHPVVHGDLKPGNILLDANLVSKLGDFGICKLLIQSNTTTTALYRTTNPKGTFAYMDPEFITTGELTYKSDVYSFGIIILRLLTGKEPLNISNYVDEALEKEKLHSIIDPSAGNWPFVQARQLAHLGLRCTELSRRKRPDLIGEVWHVIEPLMKAASLSARPTSLRLMLDDSLVPSYFICPIFQEVMSDPHIAADGFTYEAEAIKGWLDGGHDTSPMTNLKLAHTELIPNRALRSAIIEWRQQWAQ